MSVLLLNGSPHKNGCTHTALCEVQQALTQSGVDSEIVWLGNKAISPCIACGACKKTGRCAFDGGVNEFADKLRAAQGVVIGSPVFYAGPNGSLLAFLDRLYYSAGGTFAHKPAAAVVSCRRGGASATFDRLNKYFTISSQPVVSSQYWNSVHGNTPEQVRQDLEGLQVMRTLGNNMAWLIHCIEAGEQAGVAKPVKEEPQRTNFIR